MKSIIASLFGDYVVQTYVVETETTYAEVIPDGIGSLDIPFLCGFVLFCISFVCIFKILGVLLSRA